MQIRIVRQRCVTLVPARGSVALPPTSRRSPRPAGSRSAANLRRIRS